jgi:hypothetical protein
VGSCSTTVWSGQRLTTPVAGAACFLCYSGHVLKGLVIRALGPSYGYLLGGTELPVSGHCRLLRRHALLLHTVCRSSACMYVSVLR